MQKKEFECDFYTITDFIDDKIVQYSVDNSHKSNKYKIGDMLESERCGKFILDGVCKDNKFNNLVYVVRFLNTGNRYLYSSNDIKRGLARDKGLEDIGRYGPLNIAKVRLVYNRPKNEYIERVYNSNKGCKYKVIKKVDRGYKIKFLDKNEYETEIRGNPKNGISVKNPYQPIVFGYGYIGAGKYTKANSLKAYTRWKTMLQRYKNKQHHISEEFRCFQNYAEWYYNNYVEGWFVDKDVMQMGIDIKVYSSKTCLFIPMEVSNIIHDENREKMKDFNDSIDKCVKIMIDSGRFSDNVIEVMKNWKR